MFIVSIVRHDQTRISTHPVVKNHEVITTTGLQQSRVQQHSNLVVK